MKRLTFYYDTPLVVHQGEKLQQRVCHPVSRLIWGVQADKAETQEGGGRHRREGLKLSRLRINTDLLQAADGLVVLCTEYLKFVPNPVRGSLPDA